MAFSVVSKASTLSPLAALMLECTGLSGRLKMGPGGLFWGFFLGPKYQLSSGKMCFEDMSKNS